MVETLSLLESRGHCRSYEGLRSFTVDLLVVADLVVGVYLGPFLSSGLSWWSAVLTEVRVSDKS